MTKSAIRYTVIPGGMYAELATPSGNLAASLVRHGQENRVCFAVCTGAAAHLQGKVLDLTDLATSMKAINACEVELMRGHSPGLG